MNKNEVLHRQLRKYAQEIAWAKLDWSYLEIGCCEGESLLAVLRRGHPNRITICDIWDSFFGGTNRGSHAHIEALLAAEDWKPTVTFCDGPSVETVPKLIDAGAQFDLINVDGDHTYAGAALDLLHAWPLLSPGGVLMFDDIVNPDHLYLMALAERFSKLIGRPFDTLVLEDNGVCAWRKP